MPSKLTYNGFSELKDTLSTMKSVWSGELELGKSDFQVVFKTLPAAESQGWLCWALIYNTDEERHQVVPAQSQSFGSLGAVVAWHRTACLLQTLMQSLFGLVVFSYVDDFFWVAPVDPTSVMDAGWLQGFFRRVVSGLLGWQLDPSKDAYGSSVVLLGLEITLKTQASCWRLSPPKAKEWLEDIVEALQSNYLAPSTASKMCGRLSFLNSYVFGRVGRVLLRPLIWRQLQASGPMHLTARLLACIGFQRSWSKAFLGDSRTEPLY